MFVYIVSSEAFLLENCYKLGITKNPRERLSTYLTGCPPHLPISADLKYLKIFKTRASCEDDLRDYEEIIHNQFIYNRLFRKTFGDSEWFRLSAEEYFGFCEFITKSSWFDSEVYEEEILNINEAT